MAKWLKEKADSLPEMTPLAEAQPDDVLELDELWSFVESKKTNDGFGYPCVVGHARLFPTSSATVAKKAVGVCGLGYQSLIDIVSPSATSGKLMSRYLACWARHTNRLVKKRAKQRMLRDGITHCGNGWGVLSVERFRFPNLIYIMRRP